MLQRLRNISAAASRTYVAWTLTAIVLVAGLFLRFSGDAAQLSLPGNPAMALERPWTLLTYAFVSTGPLQMWVNVVLCAVLGIMFEAVNGSLRTATVFFSAVVAASLAFVATGWLTDHEAATSLSLTGCSAGLLAFIGAMLARGGHFTWIILLAALELSGIAAANPAGALAHVIGLGVGVTSCFIANGKSSEESLATEPVVDKARCSGFASLTPRERDLLFYARHHRRSIISKSNNK